MKCIKNDLEVRREKELNQAVKCLTDEIWPIVDKLDKAALLSGEILDEYFNRYSRDCEEDKMWIWWGFERNAILIRIVNDYVYAALEEIKALEQRRENIE